MAWAKAKGRTGGEDYWLGKWRVAGWEHDATVARGDPACYSAWCKLPGIKANLGCHASTALAREAVEKAVNYWLTQIPASELPTADAEANQADNSAAGASVP